ncbi:hypothetical protein HII17_09690 [Thalassotalea sp. M1531]|uniref:Uncharacterized protein n=1 Tax=Thalassotalea algicola TaxID=2716224 RepID=A0A7Y0Q756_9GAMM|nr:hypothetical protein [Thalassotalea algicola]NMP31836.1 hypothetical protein [Thalassotalea algicola]
MLQHFYSDEAVRYNSMEIAVILQKFRELLHYNKTLDQHFINNSYWIKLPEPALLSQFPFIEKGKLMRTLYRMKELGLILQKQDQSNTFWFTLNEITLASTNITEPASTQNHQPQVFASGDTVNSQVKRLWSDVDDQFIMESVAKLVVKHGYNQQHFLDIWHTFVSSMDANGEQPPARMDLIQKRFVAYANKVQLNMSHANLRYQNTVSQNQQVKEQAVENWLQYINHPREDILCKIDTSKLQTSIVEVWNSFINKSYEKQIPLKNDYQIENGFTNYVRAWVGNEQKAQTNQSYSAKRFEPVNFEDKSWADDIDLEGL